MTIAQFFKGYPQSRKLFALVRAHVESLGESRLNVMKTQISFKRERKFAWAWLPQRLVNRPKDSLTLTLSLPYEVKDRRIAEAMEASPGHWTHHVVLEKPADFDAKVRKWAKEAYENAA